MRWPDHENNTGVRSCPVSRSDQSVEFRIVAYGELLRSTCPRLQECVEGMECFVEAARSLSDEFGEAIEGDISLITGSYLIIFVYAIINLSGKPPLRSRILLSYGAIMVSVELEK